MPPKKASKKAKPSVQSEINPSFTQESFEKELKNLRAKAKEETWARWGQEQAAVYLKSLVLIALTAVYANVSELTLSPVYGSIPVSLWHNKIVVAALFVGWACNLHLGRLVPIRLSYALPIIAFYIPVAQFYLFKISGFLTAHQGPFITELLTVVPLIIFSVSCTANYLEGADLSALPGFVRDAAPGILSYGYYKSVESFSAKLLGQYIGLTAFSTRIVLETVLSASYALFSPSKYLLLVLPAVLHTGVFNTHVMTSMAVQSLNETMIANNWILIDRKESNTGYISVVDSIESGFRVMRADHSLLGGEWIRFKGKRVAEPIYGVFTMLEAVRLVETPKPIVDTEAKALVIGLGIGTLPAALVAHGVDTTVVEIDPVVHEFAAKYFQLPSNHTPVIADAITYTEDLVKEGNIQFDYVVHDVFTGGAEPVPLFTIEFLQNLHDLLKPNGVVAINYAGDFTLPPPKIVVQTIREVFPSCRIYRENARDEAVIEKENRDFTNMVIFCTKTDSPVQFRKITAADLLNSRTREMFLPPRHEVTDKDFRASGAVQTLRNNDTAALEKWHEKSALGHWAVMRTVLPAYVWENW
ncbi:S-adenosyl-L-methionine-dependent methyltransferase [Coniella lustricola]|uniref:S-adenosyl-L-methionine-dependent methyltransferase n=1 Tax=Coniella lustricola TaxID=2025994 RepID=A0A2T3A1F0_9PEZI|nr:S-adenosyl-L-methionine-dependent methyltransferase [Coniella lustricola]